MWWVKVIFPFVHGNRSYSKSQEVQCTASAILGNRIWTMTEWGTNPNDEIDKLKCRRPRSWQLSVQLFPFYFNSGNWCVDLSEWVSCASQKHGLTYHLYSVTCALALRQVREFDKKTWGKLGLHYWFLRGTTLTIIPTEFNSLVFVVNAWIWCRLHWICNKVEALFEIFYNPNNTFKIIITLSWLCHRAQFLSAVLPSRRVQMSKKTV